VKFLGSFFWSFELLGKFSNIITKRLNLNFIVEILTKNFLTKIFEILKTLNLIFLLVKNFKFMHV
jgi:hypothetical protein